MKLHLIGDIWFISRFGCRTSRSQKKTTEKTKRSCSSCLPVLGMMNPILWEHRQRNHRTSSVILKEHRHENERSFSPQRKMILPCKSHIGLANGSSWSSMANHLVNGVREKLGVLSEWSGGRASTVLPTFSPKCSTSTTQHGWENCSKVLLWKRRTCKWLLPYFRSVSLSISFSFCILLYIHKTFEKLCKLWNYDLLIEYRTQQQPARRSTGICSPQDSGIRNSWYSRYFSIRLAHRTVTRLYLWSYYDLIVD